MRILIVGIPGTGKTTVGDYLHRKRGFAHIDMEIEENLSAAFNNSVAFLSRIDSLGDNIVISWGFVPNAWSLKLIDQLRAERFDVIWFDGNRAFAFKVFQEREKQKGQESLEAAMSALRIQMQRINDTNVVRIIKPRIIDPFTSDGNFKPIEQIIEEIDVIRNK